MSHDNLTHLRDRLVAEGARRLSQPRGFMRFTREPEADEMINDLETYPHAFVISCIMDRQMPAERAWRIPYELKQRLGSFRFRDLVLIPPDDLETAMKQPSTLHRFPVTMARYAHAAIGRIAAQYQGDASAIWADTPSSATIVRRFLEFDGVGQKIATMAANTLVRDFRIPVRDKYSIDISVDVQVRRVFSRMGFVPGDATAEYIVYRARELNPEYPGIFDLVLWELGRSVCVPKEPDCRQCRWSDLCMHALTSGSRR